MYYLIDQHFFNVFSTNLESKEQKEKYGKYNDASQ